MKGGKKEGAGRPKGALNKTTLEQKLIKDEIHNRVLKSKGKLINSQFSLAIGCSYLYKVSKIGSKTPILVKDPKEIEKYFAGDFDEGGSDYYFITTEKPDMKAIQDLWDRIIGKPVNILEGDIKINISSILNDIE